MRFPTSAAAAAGIVTLVVSAASFAADSTPMQTSQNQMDDQQVAATVRDLQTRLDRDEQLLHQMQSQLPSPPSSSHQFCSDGYDPYRGSCN
ncbi:MAG: hypothetical protein U1E53_33470 [Dongiaceae bacterium]